MKMKGGKEFEAYTFDFVSKSRPLCSTITAVDRCTLWEALEERRAWGNSCSYYVKVRNSGPVIFADFETARTSCEIKRRAGSSFSITSKCAILVSCKKIRSALVQEGPLGKQSIDAFVNIIQSTGKLNLRALPYNIRAYNLGRTDNFMRGWEQRYYISTSPSANNYNYELEWEEKSNYWQPAKAEQKFNDLANFFIDNYPVEKRSFK